MNTITLNQSELELITGGGWAADMFQAGKELAAEGEANIQNAASEEATMTSAPVGAVYGTLQMSTGGWMMIIGGIGSLF